jgi:hypothetical protein
MSGQLRSQTPIFMTTEELARLDEKAESLYDWCLARQLGNLNKDGSPGDPRRVGCLYGKSMDQVKHFYRNAVLWGLTQNQTSV